MRSAAQLLSRRKARDGAFKPPAPRPFSAPPQSPPGRATLSLRGLYGDKFHVLLNVLVQIVAGRLLWVFCLLLGYLVRENYFFPGDVHILMEETEL